MFHGFVGLRHRCAGFRVHAHHDRAGILFGYKSGFGHIDKKHQQAERDRNGAPQQPSAMDDVQYPTYITAAQAVENRIECFAETCRKVVLRVSVFIDIRLQEQGAQCRRKGEGIDRRNAHGNRHRDAELRIESP